jgi:subtilisin family serine protease
MLRTVAAATVALLMVPVVAPIASAGLLGLQTPGTLLVGTQPGAADVVTSLVGTLGGTITGSSSVLDVLRVQVPDLATAKTALSLSSLVTYVEVDGRAALNGAEWNGAQWNTVRQNGADWNGADWNGADWNGAQWNGAEWNNLSGAPASENDPGRAIQWGLLAGDVPPAWATPTDHASPICVVDSGVALDHPDLAANAWTAADGSHGINFVTPNTPPMDDAGHGTHVAGIAAAVVGNGLGIAGIGNEPIMSVKVLDSTGHGKESDVAFGIAWCATHGAKVLLLALSSDGTRTMKAALAYAAAHDVLLVASAGNKGPCSNCVGFPGSDPHVLAVSAVSPSLALAAFSSSGPQVALAAPGVSIVGTFLGGKYAYGSGTSQAAAFVAGAAALVRDAGNLDAQQTRDALTQHAHDLGAPGRDASYGAGLIDVAAAMNVARG